MSWTSGFTTRLTGTHSRPSGSEVSGTTRPEVECFATGPSFALGAGTYCYSKTEYILVYYTG